MKKIQFVLLALMIALSASAQKQKITAADLAHIKVMEDTLQILAFAMVKDSAGMNRFAAVKKFIPTLVKTLKTKNSFQYKFDKLKSISILYPQDSSFRVFSWQLKVSESVYKYYGAIQVNSEELNLVPLIDRSDKMRPGETPTSMDRWIGALYYNILQFDSPLGRKYLLFGLHQNDLLNKTKAIDVLNFEDGKFSFGAPVFEKTTEDGEKRLLDRIFITYSAESLASMNYQPEKGMIVYDHIVRITDPRNGKPLLAPDGSYEGYELKKGIWRHVDKLYHQVFDEPPGTIPTKEKKVKRDIFGRRIK